MEKKEEKPSFEISGKNNLSSQKAETLSVNDDPAAAASRLIKALHNYYESEHLYVFTVDPAADCVNLFQQDFQKNSSADNEKPKRIPLSILNLWLQNLQEQKWFQFPENSDSALTNALIQLFSETSLKIEKLLAVPLDHENQLIGFVCIVNPAAHTAEKDFLICMSTYLSDEISRKKNSRKCLKTAYEPVLEIIKHSPEVAVLLISDKENRISPLVCSDSFYKMVGETQENVWSLFSSLPCRGICPDDFPNIHQEIMDHLKTREPFKTDCRMINSKDEYFWVNISYSFPVISGRQYIYAAYTNIDAYKRQEADLERRYRSYQAYLEGASASFLTTVRADITEDRLDFISGYDAEIEKDYGAGSYSRMVVAVSSRICRQKDRDTFLQEFSREAILESFQSGKNYKKLTYYSERKDGNPIWIETSINMVLNPINEGVTAFIYSKDINSQKISDIIFKNYFENHFDYIEYINGRRNTALPIVLNKISEKYLRSGENLDYEETVEKLIRELVIPEEMEACLKFMKLANVVEKLEKKDSCSFSCTMKDAEGKLHNKKLEFFYLDRENQQMALIQSDFTDIQKAQNELTENLRMALQAAEQASSAKTEFLSRMSHEIRTPMNAIIGLDAIALQEKGLSSSMEDHLTKIGISARFLLSLINDILDMSRIESGKMSLRKEEFNFEEFINGINTILYEQCRDSGLDYDCIVKGFTEETYVGDSTKLQQVLVNVLGNAVKFTPTGGKIHFMIEQVSRTKEKAAMRFTVSDTGIGIDSAFLPHIFEAFTQESRGNTSVYGGTGLGLAISKNIVTLMGGNIAVHSIKNVGTEFTIDVNLDLSQSTRIKHRMISDLNLKSLETLIVDDDVIVCQHTQIILRDSGFAAEWVDSGQGAIEMVENRRKSNNDYDLILIDWKMPIMDGIETTREIRKIVGPEVTIIIMTAYDWSEIEDKALAAGVDMFMKKPVFASSVTRAIEQVFRRKSKEFAPETEPEFDFSGKRILLAEDNVINTEIEKSLLEEKHAAVDTAENGVDAIEKFTTSPVGYYDMILMDVRMPLMDGLEATRAIRNLKKSDSKTIPIIAMTANAFDEDVNRSLKSGMNEHLTKPIDPQMMYATLQKYFKKEN